MRDIDGWRRVCPRRMPYSRGLYLLALDLQAKQPANKQAAHRTTAVGLEFSPLATLSAEDLTTGRSEGKVTGSRKSAAAA